MNTISRTRRNYTLIKLKKLIIVSLLIGFLSSILAISLKKITEYYETIFFNKAINNPLFFLLFPIIGLSVIFFLRQYLFKKNE